MARTAAGQVYGDAIFELAQETQHLEQMEDDLLYVQQLLTESTDLRGFLYSPVVEKADKIKVVDAIFREGIAETALHFLYIMIQRNRVQSLSDAIDHFVVRSRDARGIVSAKVRVAKALTEAQRTKLLDRLTADTGKTIMLREVLDPTILGGMVVEIGDKRYDASVARRLHDMETMLRRDGGVTTEIGVKESV